MHLKQYEIVQNQDLLKVDIQEVMMTHKTIKHYAYILHDKDDTRPHYHIYVNFGNSGVDSADVAKWFGVPENFVNKIRGRRTDMLLYLTHGQDNQKHKHQYSPSEVVANFDFELEIEKSKILGNFEKYSYAEQLKYVDGLAVSEKAKAFSQLEKLWRLQCQCLSLTTDRSITVVFVCGKAGAGKTYYAKKLLASFGFDYCISSSSNDPFQDYLGQKGMILDDLRYMDFELPDLLKILDNNTASSVKSRFANKVFNGEMIVITSSVPLRYWYPQYRFNKDDTLEQLYRRINFYVKVEEQEITVFKALDEKGEPCGMGTVYKNELYLKKRETEEKKLDVMGAFDRICESADGFTDDLPF